MLPYFIFQVGNNQHGLAFKMLLVQSVNKLEDNIKKPWTQITECWMATGKGERGMGGGTKGRENGDICNSVNKKKNKGKNGGKRQYRKIFWKVLCCFNILFYSKSKIRALHLALNILNNYKKLWVFKVIFQIHNGNSVFFCFKLFVEDSD